MMKTQIQKVNRTLFELETGIFIFAVICQFVLLFFSNRKELSIGLWTGVFMAFFCAWHMWWTLERGLELGEKGAAAYLGRQNMIRYILIVMVLGLTALWGIGNPLTAFTGVMGLKVSAYMQPLTKKISKIFYEEKKLQEAIAEEPVMEQEIRR